MRVFAGIIGLIWKVYILLIFSSTALLFYPLIVPFLFSEKVKKIAFRFFVAWSWVFRILTLYVVCRIENAKLPEGPCMIVANHASYLDIFLMPSLMARRPFIFLGKAELLRYPLIKTYFKYLNVPVYRDSKIKAARSIVQASQMVEKGWSVVVFPEGGILDAPKPSLHPFKPGAFLIAKSGSLPIVPVTFLNNFQLFSDPTELLGVAGPGISKVRIHQAISKEEVEHLSVQELSARCFRTIESALKDYYPEMK